MHSVCIVEILVTVKCIKIFIVAEQCFCDTFISQASITHSIMSLNDVPEAAVKHKSACFFTGFFRCVIWIRIS